MKIGFLKKENEKHVFTCTRENGTVTWMNLDTFYLRHDLLHYAVETSLHYTSAFYGMIANGISITDFELPKERRSIVFTDEAVQAEHVVNLMMIESGQGKFDDFNTNLQESFRQSRQLLNPVSLTAEQLKTIHSTYDLLLQQWEKLPPGETLSLDF